MLYFITEFRREKLDFTIYCKDFSFQIKSFSFPLLDNYRRSFRTSGPHQYSANIYIHIYIYIQYSKGMACIYIYTFPVPTER